MDNAEISPDQFVKLIEVFDKRVSPGFLFKQAVQTALAREATALARLLAQSGAKLYPDNTPLQKMSAVLASARVINATCTANPGLAKSMAWIQAHSRDYGGSWVAVDNRIFLFAASTRGAVIEHLGVGNLSTDILITWIP